MAIKNYKELVSQLNKATEIAVKNTANRLCETLKEIIQTKYYDQYPDPSSYDRTYKFLHSAVAKMVTDSSATIGIDDSYFDYKYPVQYTSQSSDANLSQANLQPYVGHWTGEDQVNMAANGMHGNAYIQTDGRFWREFIEYCDKNARIILREELKKQGINIK